jgi:large subunit ribosomal protein L9
LAAAAQSAAAALPGTVECVIATDDARIADACTAQGHKVARSEVRMPNGPIRSVGEHAISLHLHTDVDVQLQLIVIAEE